jgi:hypothetical protein
MMKELPAVLDPEFSLYPSEELPKNWVKWIQFLFSQNI